MKLRFGDGNRMYPRVWKGYVEPSIDEPLSSSLALRVELQLDTVRRFAHRSVEDGALFLLDPVAQLVSLVAVLDFEPHSLNSFHITYTRLWDALSALGVERVSRGQIITSVMREGQRMISQRSRYGIDRVPLVCSETLNDAAFLRFIGGRGTCDIVLTSASSVESRKRVGVEEGRDCEVNGDYQRKRRCVRESDTCTICLEGLLVGSHVMCLPCSHVFHVRCIKMWLKKMPFCPLCRAEAPTL